MKIKTKALPYEKVMELPRPKHRKPLRPMWILQLVIRVLAIFDLLPTKFTYTWEDKHKIGRKEPCLILMNHSSFIDLKIASRIFFPKRYGIVCTHDALVGKAWLMRLIGCIPTQKFVSDMSLVQDMSYMLKEKKTSVLMYPEAGYTFDGKTTLLPRKMGVLLKKLGVSVVMVTTSGAYLRDPLYNGLQLRKTKVSAKVEVLATAEELKALTVCELDEKLEKAFSFDNFREQQEKGVVINEPFRADGLNRILYRCPHCNTEGSTKGKGVSLTCFNCGAKYTLTESGYLEAVEGEGVFNHVPDWYEWERQQVKKELEEGTYRLDIPVKIGVLIDYKALYMVGEGRLVHSDEGFTLTGCDGKLHYTQGPLSSHSLNSDYFWYEIGDVIGIGDRDALYYCFPLNGEDVVAKARLAAEELYKLKKPARIKA